MKKYLIHILVLIPILYFTISRYIIRLIYENKFIELFNNIITGESEHPLDYYYSFFDRLIIENIFGMILIIPFIFLVFKPSIITNGELVNKWMKSHTDYIDSIPLSNLGILIALSAGLGLFLELMMIRIHASYFQLFAFFKNLSLLSCFLGLGIGYARGTKSPLITPIVLPLLALQLISLSYLSEPLYGLSNPISEQFSMGLAQSKNIYQSIISFLFIALIFSYNSLCFIPLGQLTSRLMARQEKLLSYSWNLIGSLSGIILFSIISFLWLPPSFWFTIFSIGLLMFIYKNKKQLIISIFSFTAVLIIFSMPNVVNELVIYSPYQKLTLRSHNSGIPQIRTNDKYFQNIHNLNKKIALTVNTNRPDTLSYLEEVGQFYALPYYFQKNPNNVLVLASGTGNDVAAALANNAKHIDAVEIDPVIQKMGELVHPQSPYSSEKVSIFVDDARSFLKKTKTKYDLIVYGLLDAHTLLSGKSGGIRLDSYIYTTEAFREAREKLNENGLICLSFATLSPHLGKKLYLMLKEGFDGHAPTVYLTHDGGHTFLIGYKNIDNLINEYTTYQNVTTTIDNSQLYTDKTTDNWPFFYMPKKVYPITYLLMIVLIILISTFYVRNLSGMSLNHFSFPCFFLGAGFMLIETKGITELSLYYGNTWIVVGIVISTILIMAFLANLILLKIQTPSNYLIYGSLFMSLILGIIFTYIRSELSIPFYLDKIIGTILLTIPLFYSGFAFSYELKNSTSVMVALSSNILGAIVGGCLEYNSMYFGFRALYLLAIVMYILSFLSSIQFKRKTIIG
tara:strand:- start:147 stop:2531 length:2385 start_codon:yes stop_codon:yes gene_type:complete